MSSSNKVSLCVLGIWFLEAFLTWLFLKSLFLDGLLALIGGAAGGGIAVDRFAGTFHAGRWRVLGSKELCTYPKRVQETREVLFET